MSQETVRRVHQRIPIKLPVTLHGLGDELLLTTENISLGGAFLLVDESLCQVGDKVTLGISFPKEGNQEPLRAQINGVVAHAVPPLGVGIQFRLADDRASTELLRKFIARLQAAEKALQ